MNTDMNLRPNSGSSRSQRLFLTGFLGVALAAVVFNVAHGESSTTDSPTSAVPALTDEGALPRGGPIGPGEQCVGAKALTERDLRTGEFITPVYLPAEQDTLTSTWVCPDTNSPTAMYGELEVSWDPGWQSVNTSEKFAGLANERDHAEPTSFAGYDGMVNYPSESSPYPMALFVVGDTAVMVRAKDAAFADQVIELAREIAKSAKPVEGRGVGH